MDVVLMPADYVYVDSQAYVCRETDPRLWGEAHTYRRGPEGYLLWNLWIT